MIVTAAQRLRHTAVIFGDLALNIVALILFVAAYALASVVFVVVILWLAVGGQQRTSLGGWLKWMLNTPADWMLDLMRSIPLMRGVPK